MIYGALGDIEEYRGMLKGLDVLIDWLEENDPAELEVGSHPILGDKVYANVMAPTTRPEAEAHYETHQRQLQSSKLPSQSEFFVISKHFTATPRIPPTSVALKVASINCNFTVEPQTFTTDLTTRLRSL